MQASKAEMDLLDIMTSKDLDHPGVLPDDAVDVRKWACALSCKFTAKGFYYS
jgi:hypothetical protein